MNPGIQPEKRDRLLRFTLLILLLAAGGIFPFVARTSSGQTLSRNSSSPGRSAAFNRVKPLTIGERLVYNISWSNIPSAARLEIETGSKGLYHGRESYLLQTRVLTLNEGWSVFGEVDNQYSSYIDLKSSLPHRVVSSIRQGRVSATQEEQVTVIDQSRGTATLGNGAQTSIPASTYDLPSLLFALRTSPLTGGDRMRYNVLFNQQLIEIDVEVVERSRLDIQSGSFKAICLRLSPRKQNRYRTTLWLSDDTERTPLLIRAGTTLGEVRAELTSATLAWRSKNSPVGLAPANQSAQTPPFKVGERLGYNISWGNFINVGRASFEVRQSGLLDSQPVLELFGEAASSGPIRSLITVNDQITSLVLADRLVPLRSDLRLREGRRVKTDTAVLDHSALIATLNNGTAFTIQPGTLDLVALFYNIRAAEIKPGESRQFSFLDANHRPRTITVRGLVLETVASPTGPRASVRLEILNPQNEVLAIGWVSSDRQRLPLQFTARARFGEIRFRLVSIVGN